MTIYKIYNAFTYLCDDSVCDAVEMSTKYIGSPLAHPPVNYYRHNVTV